MRERSPGKWELRVYTGRDPVTGRPQQVSRTFHGGKRAASRALDALAVEVHEGRHGGSRTLFSKLLDEFVLHLERVGRSQSTVELYQNHIRKWIKPGLGMLRMDRLTARHLDDYYGGLEGKLAAGTVNVHHAIISGALKQGMRWKWITSNVAMLATPTKDTARAEDPPTPEEVQTLIARAEAEEDHELALLVGLTALTGCRRGEICGLRWEDVDWETRTIRVQRQIVPGKGGDRIDPPKSGDERKVGLGSYGVPLLKRYQEVQQERFPGWKPGGWLISYNGGETPLSPRRVTEHIRSLGERSNIKVRPHALRRFAATYLVSAGTDIRTVSGRLGHSPEMTLDTYSAFLPAMDQQAADVLGKAIFGPQDDPDDAQSEKPGPPSAA
jgi:integrase